MQPRTLRLLAVGSLVLLAVAYYHDSFTRANVPPTVARPHLRRPVALALADKGAWLFAAGRDSGNVSVLDTARLRVESEVRVGRRLTDLVLTPNQARLLATDEETGELIVLDRAGPDLKISARVKVGPSPVSVRTSADGSRCSVALHWPRQLALVELAAPGGPRVAATVALPFAPRLQLLLADSGKLLVAESFGGHLAVVDLGSGRVESLRELPAHNLRGLARSADGSRVLVSHQTLNRYATTDRDDLHWGNLIGNSVTELLLTSVLDARADLLRGSRAQHLGDVGRGAGDPATLAVAPDGRIAVALAGVAEVAVSGKKGAWQRRAVGQRPSALAFSPDSARLFVANMHADSITVLDGERATEVRLGPSRPLNEAERGEVLFHDARLSLEGWFSCHSCHTDGHSNGRLADTFADGSYGSPKRVLSLLGTQDTGPWAWNGSMTDLEAQVRQSLATTMHAGKQGLEHTAALTAYLRTLAPAPPLGRFRAQDMAAVGRGEKLFEQHGCARCHAPPTYTSAKISAGDGVRLNPPSLRGVSQGGPYFHDGRATTLAEVFARHRHQLRGNLSASELEDLLALLHTL